MHSPGTGYYDIHNHILPGVDDGPEDLQGSLELAKACITDGALGIIATPHVSLGSDLPGFISRRNAAMAELTGTLASRGIDLALKPGAEVMIRHNGAAQKAYDDFEKLGSQLTLGNSNLLLVEYGVTNEPLWFEDSLFRFQDIGFQPVIAHMERYPWLKSQSRVEKLADKGIYMQVNVESLKGLFSVDAMRMRRMIKSGLVHFVATDAHGIERRKPEMATADQKQIMNLLANSEMLFKHEGSDTLYI